MKKHTPLKHLLTIMLAISCFQFAAARDHSQSFWKKNSPVGESMAKRSWMPTHFETFSLETEQMRSFLLSAPSEQQVASRRSGFIIELPMPDGRFNSYTLAESPVMEKGLADAYPFIKTYAGQGISDPTATIRLDITQFGFHAYVLSANGTVYIDPVVFGNTDDYIVYYKSDIPGELYRFNCLLQTDEERNELNNEHNKVYQPSSFQSIGSQLRTYRLALAADYEYTTYYGGTKAGALAGMVTSMNRVNGVYERELDIHMNMVANDTLLIYTTSSDPYTNNSGSTMLTENQTTCNSVIGSANYDMGHVFSTGGGGVANLGCVCGSSKAKGVTGSGTPVGDAFDIDYVVHEMGHQFGGNHTFNATTGSCNGNRASTAAYESGSASTIMGYAGICTSANDLQAHSDAYFHTKNFDEIITYSQTGNGNTCAAITATGNNAPILSIPSSTYSIPYQTPFRLTASASDPDGDSVTYCWEEYDLGPSGTWNAPSGNAPIFRSFNPSISPTRLFPKLANILNNTTTIGEIKASYARTLTFRCTARDNQAGGGGVIHSPSTVTLNVINTNIAFAITYPNVTGISWVEGDQDTVKWNVASTDVTPISTPFVNIYLSADNGNTFADTIAMHVPNNGSYAFIVPNTITTTARIMVEGDGNVFFDINDKAFAITMGVGIHENTLSHSVLIYPNPVTNAVHLVVRTPLAGKAGIMLLDITGRILREIHFEKNNLTAEQVLDVSSLAKGMYLVRVELPEGITEKKFIKE
ncbi:MAG: M12 family metallo-peptidase [Bacteroidetes bacterium]|nr:M12 family metallo-peptidase [Bacteroidota bacterium]